jgi:tetratricopeptide (TPR) repeat protein
MDLIDRLSGKKKDGKYWRDRGVDLAGQKKYQEAVEAYKTSLEIEPDNANAVFNMGNSLREMGDLTGALSLYEKVLTPDPANPEFWNNKGTCLFITKRYDEALQAFDAV